MPLIAVTIVAIIIAVLAGKAGKGGMAKFFGLVAFLAFIGWMATGPGFAMLDFLNEGPDVKIPNVEINK